MVYSVEVLVRGTEGSIFAPVGLSSPASCCTGCIVSGGSARILTEPGSGQEVLLVVPDGPEVAFLYEFSGQPAAYPDRTFHPVPSRYTRTAKALAGEALQMAGQGDDLTRAIRLARGVADKFTYAHPEVKFNDGLDHIPHLGCGLTEGSCVDIHTYLVATFRAAGIEAGHVVGYYFPEGGPCSGGHCWVVTRIGGGTQEWDVSHFLQMDRRDVEPALNPKGGFRVPVGYSMGLSLPEIGIDDIKLLVEPMVMRNGVPQRFVQKRIRLLG